MNSFRAFDIVAGGFALLAGLCGSFLFAADDGAGFFEFTVLASCLVLLAGIVLASRTVHPVKLVPTDVYSVDRLVRLLPAELAYQLRLKQGNAITVESIVSQLSTHIEDQQMLLNNNMQNLLYPDYTATEVVLHSEHTLSLLISELTTLEDQYATDVKNSKNDNDANPDATLDDASETGSPT